MSLGLVKVNVEHVWYVMVFDVDQTTPKTGLVDANFTKRLATENAVSGQAVAINEVSAGSFPGLYRVRYTPNATGRWYCWVSHATLEPNGFENEVQAFTVDVDDLPILSEITGGILVTPANKLLTDAAGHVTVGAIASAVITAASIATDAITAAKIAADAITSAKIQDAAITANKIATDAITAAKIATDAIAASKIATGAITAAKFAAGAIDAAAIATNALTAAKLAADLGNKIADHVWRRQYGNARASADGDALSFRSALGAVAKLVNRVRIQGNQLEVYHQDDSTILAQQTVTTTAGANPITEIDSP